MYDDDVFYSFLQKQKILYVCMYVCVCMYIVRITATSSTTMVIDINLSGCYLGIPDVIKWVHSVLLYSRPLDVDVT